MTTHGDQTALRAGDPVTVRKLRWGASAPKWVCASSIREVTAEGFTTWTPSGTAFRMADGSAWTSRDDAVDRYQYGAWHQVMEFGAPPNRWYVNIMTPIEVDDHVLSWCDLEVDVEAFGDGSFHLSDIPELVRAHESYGPKVLERIRQAVEAVVGDVRAQRPPFRRIASAPAYGSEESRFWLIPGAGDGIAVLGEVEGLAHPSIDRMLAQQRPASVHAAASNPLMVLPNGAPPRDGVLIAGAPAELPLLLPHARATMAMYGGRVPVTLALALREDVDPLAELHAALDADEPPLVLELDGALRRAGIPSRGTVVAQRFVAASWF